LISVPMVGSRLTTRTSPRRTAAIGTLPSQGYSRPPSSSVATQLTNHALLGNRGLTAGDNIPRNLSPLVSATRSQEKQSACR
jgi:hypothetical protein